MSTIRRADSVTLVDIANNGTTSAAIDFRNYAGGAVAIPSAITSTTLTFTVSNSATGTFTALYDGTNTQSSITIAASRAYPLPDELFAWPYFKFVLGSAEGAARVLTFVAKG